MATVAAVNLELVESVYMAVKKGGALLVKLVSSAKTGFFYVKKRNPKKLLSKLSARKYDPVIRKHVVFNEEKLK